MEQRKTTISNNEFITLFIMQLQNRYLLQNEGSNYLNGDLHFDSEALKDFIYHSKRDPRYSEFLSCFNFTINQNRTYCVELATALNYALMKRLITTRVGDINYVSRICYSYSIEVNWEWMQIMACFLNDFSAYINNPEAYIHELETSSIIENNLSASDSFRFYLQRSLISQKHIQYNTRDKS